MGCISCRLDIRSSESILDHQTRLYVHNLEEKFLSHLHCMVFGDLWGHGALSIQAVPLSLSLLSLRIRVTSGMGQLVSFRRCDLFSNRSFPGFFIQLLSYPIKENAIDGASSSMFSLSF
jgi:hypothetical protein